MEANLGRFGSNKALIRRQEWSIVKIYMVERLRKEGLYNQARLNYQFAGHPPLGTRDDKASFYADQAFCYGFRLRLPTDLACVHGHSWEKGLLKSDRIPVLYSKSIFYHCSCTHNMTLNLPRSYKVLQIIFILVINDIYTQLYVFACIYCTFYNSCINPTCHTPNDWKLETQALCQVIHL